MEQGHHSLNAERAAQESIRSGGQATEIYDYKTNTVAVQLVNEAEKYVETFTNVGNEFSTFIQFMEGRYAHPVRDFPLNFYEPEDFQKRKLGPKADLTIDSARVFIVLSDRGIPRGLWEWNEDRGAFSRRLEGNPGL
ncbi:hypothetical protein HK104_006331 [Borealophlyctis nickersoniae]|nr:hypothetical protein HK104_006331 [Borealophlyctis nickersoniae]